MIHNLPLAQTAGATPWQLTVVIGAVCITLCWAVERYCREPSQRLSQLQKIPVVLLAVKAMEWTGLCWPQEEKGHIALILLTLAAWTGTQGREEAAAGALRHLIRILVGIVLLSGLREISLENLKPQWLPPDPTLAAVLLVPAICRRKEACVRAWLTAVTYSIFTQGILSAEVAQGVPAPFWELGRSMSLLGTTERFESLIAVALTLGYYGFLSHLMARGRWLWLPTVVLYLSGASADGALITLAALVFWVFLPLSEALKNNLRNMKKGVDKC